jgi:hypothetical protein
MAAPLKSLSSKDKIRIAALDDEAYVSRLSARTALYTELRLLLGGIEDPLTAPEYRQLVVQQNRLSRPSTSAREKLWTELKGRYLLSNGNPLFRAFWCEWRSCRAEQERNLTAYTLFALNDRLVADLGTEWLYPYLRQAPAEVRVEDVLSFIDRSTASHPEVGGWSHETRARVARHYMASVRDFGVTRGKTIKSTVRPALYGAPVRLIIRALQLAQFDHFGLLRARIFRLLAIDEGEVFDALGELNKAGALRFRMQGDVVELDVERQQVEGQI